MNRQGRSCAHTNAIYHLAVAGPIQDVPAAWVEGVGEIELLGDYLDLYDE